MKEYDFHHIYGPVLSRRLGRSLGIDLVPLKTCTYDCIYCQLGRTTNKTLERKEYGAIEETLSEVESKLTADFTCDFISVAGSGEPTLNNRIGDLILEIKKLTRIPVAVLTNGSLLWMKEVREALMHADLILPSLDAGDDHLFQYVNRPHGEIPFSRMVEGLFTFTRSFPKAVWLEVFLLAGVTGIQAEVEKISVLTERIRPAKVQLNTVSRPPSEDFACPVARNRMEQFRNLFPVETDIITYEKEWHIPSASPSVWAINNKILSLLKRRPCTLSDVALSMGIHPTDAAKCLDDLGKAGPVSQG